VKWILDHCRFLESQMVETRDALTRQLYRALPRCDSESNSLPWIHALARDFVHRTVRRDIAGEMNCHSLEPDTLIAYFEAAQKERALCLVELWAIKPLIKLSLLESLGNALIEHSEDSPTCAAVARSVVTNLYALDGFPWREVTESLSSLDEVLRLDPLSVYERMDFETRDAYRRAAEGLARRSALSEEEVGRLAIELAFDGRCDNVGEEPRDHVGYYLLGRGLGRLEARMSCRPSIAIRVRRTVEQWAGLVYPASIGVVTALMVAALAPLLRPAPGWFWLLLILPVTQAAVAIVNRIVTAVVPPRRLPRMDFSHGVPEDCRTFVVVPTLLLSRDQVDVLVERLEIHYLANRDPNLRFALLTDGADAAHRTDQDELAEICRQRIERLNERYSRDAYSPFYLFHRGRRWNERESVWMGHERKRGKLNDFNSFLLGESDRFEIKAGDLSAIRDIRYVITLDADTQLPLDTARHLIGTAAHPLNRPVVDPRSNMVRQGYAILQPRIGISMASTERSRFASLQSGAVGLDSYTTAVSDVYQDLCGQASFTGKGLYDLHAFHRAVAARFPDNTLLSHDVIEGEHARVGLVTDVEIIDDYPSSYEAFSKRKHRWIRGDWQLVRWLLPRVPHASGASVANPLSFLSRWKILDNLRRSALEASALALIVFGWRAGHALGSILVLTFLLNAGAYLDLLISTLRLPPRRALRSYMKTKVAQLGQSHVETVAFLVFLLHQTLVTTDAIVRSLARQFITGRRLLEWESMAQAESSPNRGHGLVRWSLFLTPVASCALLAGLWPGREHAQPAIAASMVWMASSWAARWLDRQPSQPASWSSGDLKFLRDVAVRTWRYFLDWSQPDTHWLVPDNIDEASGRVAYRTSPTNIGLQLGAALAAHDLGFHTHQELSVTLTRTLDTLDRLETHRGHFYNWYDTRTLGSLRPRYVSAVVSGNLCASLLTAKQACLEILNEPIVSRQLWDGLRDHCAQVRRALPAGTRPRSLRAITLMLDGASPLDDLSASLRTLNAMRALAVDTIERLAALSKRGASQRANEQSQEAGYWSAALLDRIDAAVRDVHMFAPFIETSLSRECAEGALTDRLREIEEAAHRMPTLAGAQRHYDDLECAVLDCLNSPMCVPGATAERLSRFLEQISDARRAACEALADLQSVADRASRFVERTDFAFLFDCRRKLLRVGYNADTQELDPYCYGLLASEARTAVFVAIAKRDIPREAWFHLGRKLTCYGKYRTLVSWSGTMFEYAMPALFMKSSDHTLLGASIQRAVRIQQLYGRERGVPWGMSEAAYSACDETQGRRYQAFGVPDLAMKRMHAWDLVVAPYATLLALMIDRAAALDNLRSMASRGYLGRYGFYESIDCRGQGVDLDRATPPRTVPLFMAHHQGMSLMALGNALCDNAMQRRFHTEPIVLTAELLLQERLPALMAEGDMDVLPSEIPVAPHLQVVARWEREIVAPSEGAIMRPRDMETSATVDAA
jgi:cyclic beta-1,2-glucan synthetase